MEKANRKVYNNGIVSFFHREYSGECLKNHTSMVTLFCDPDRILKILAYTCSSDGQHGELLGCVKMMHTEELGIGKDQLKSGQFSLTELKAILTDLQGQKNAIVTCYFNPAIDRYDFVESKLKDKKRKSQQKNRTSRLNSNSESSLEKKEQRIQVKFQQKK